MNGLQRFVVVLVPADPCTNSVIYYMYSCLKIDMMIIRNLGIGMCIHVLGAGGWWWQFKWQIVELWTYR